MGLRKFDDKATWRTEFGRDVGIDVTQPARAERVFDPNDSVTTDPTPGGIAGFPDTTKITTATRVLYTDQTMDLSLSVDRAYEDFKTDVASSRASFTTSLTGANNDLVYTAKEAGANGNAITVAYVNPGTPSASLSVSESGSAITVHLATDAGTAATAVLTSDTTEPVDGDTVTINNQTYRFKTTPAQANDIKRSGSSADTDLGNLVKAVNQSGVGDGSDYYAGTVAPTGVSAGAVASHATTLTATTVGTAANSFASTTTSSHLSFGGTTFSGGVDPAITSTASNILADFSSDTLVTVALAPGNSGAGVVTALSATNLSGGVDAHYA